MYKLTIDRIPIASYKITPNFLKAEGQGLLLQIISLFLTVSVDQPQTATEVLKSDQQAEARSCAVSYLCSR